MEIPKKLKKRIRSLAGASGKPWSIKIIQGYSAPRVSGMSWHYENASGDIIRHPSAYRKAWGKPIYCFSTKRIEVGEGWLKAAMTLAEDTPPQIVQDYAQDNFTRE